MIAVRVYLDYAATAPVRPEVRAAVEPLLFGSLAEGRFGNASSVHWAGQSARRELEQARTRVARRLGAQSGEIVFTSGGSEADNLALLGLLRAPRRSVTRLITSAVEHPAVRSAAFLLEQEGTPVTIISVDAEGALDLDGLATALEGPPALVSLMAVNNETGVIHDLDAALALVRSSGPHLLHVDAVQSAGKLPLPEDADLVTISGHKLGGLKGIGALRIGKDIALSPTVVGGPQERARRAGTENVAAAVALATALEVAIASQDAENARVGALTRQIEGIVASLSGTRIVGRNRVASTVTAVFEGSDGEALLQALDLEGIAASSGSACSSGSLEPSHVLTAMGISPALALSAVRFSLGFQSSQTDVDRLQTVLPRVLSQVRTS